MVSLVCTRCYEMNVDIKPKKDFLGNQTFVCQGCRFMIIYPLTSGWNIATWAALLITGLATASSLVQGGIPVIPGLLVAAFGYTLFRDFRLRREVAEARAIRQSRLPRG